MSDGGSNTHRASLAPVHDTARAFCPGGLFDLAALAPGPLNGLGFAAKDLYDVQGKVTGAGSPAWASTHGPATRSAWAIDALRRAGADFRGKTLTDELAYSINGDNVHYGTPVNAKAPERFPGGSSSGSAAAVAAGSVDFALGTDSGGSNRIPASFCGVIGMRSTHGRISRDGLIALMPSFDTVGWFARDIDMFLEVGDVLLGHEAPCEISEIAIVEDAFEQCWPLERHAAQKASTAIEAAVTGGVRRIRIAPESLEQWRLWYRVYSAAESWAVHGEWIRRESPVFSPAIRDRFRFAVSVTPPEAEAARRALDRVRQSVRARFSPHTAWVVPTAPGMAPRLTATAADIEDFRQRAQRLTCIAGIAGLPEISLPLVAGLPAPMNMSIIGPPGSDLALIRFARSLGAPRRCRSAP